MKLRLGQEELRDAIAMYLAFKGQTGDEISWIVAEDGELLAEVNNIRKLSYDREELLRRIDNL